MQLPVTARANFGLTAGSHVMGYMTNATLTKLGFRELASGAGWIVRRWGHSLIPLHHWIIIHNYRGRSYVNESVKEEEINESFVVLKAPRTVIAAHSNGSLYLVQVGNKVYWLWVWSTALVTLYQVDGIERDKIGLDLYEMAEVLIAMGLYQAVVSPDYTWLYKAPSFPISLSSRILTEVAVVSLCTREVSLASQLVLTQPLSVSDESLPSHACRASSMCTIAVELWNIHDCMELETSIGSSNCAWLCMYKCELYKLYATEWG